MGRNIFVFAAVLAGAAALQSPAPARAAPDLSVRARLDVSNRLIVDVANRGDSAVPAGVGGLGVFIDGRPVGGYRFGNLTDQSFRQPGGVIAIPTNFRLGGAMRRVSAIVDGANEIAEAREDQNSYSVSLNPPHIPGPDFIVSGMEIERGYLKFSIRNIGDRAAPSGLTSRARVIIDNSVEADLTLPLAGLDRGRDRIVRPSPPISVGHGQRVRILLNMNHWDDETDNTNNVREETLPSPSILVYALWLLNPEISDAIRWNMVSYPDWTRSQKTDLADTIRDVENGFGPGPSTPPTLNADRRITEADAWRIYLHHVAHALWLDRHHKTPWRLTDMSPSQLRLLLDSEKLIARVTTDGSYHYNTSFQGNLTVWNPRISYQFMTNLGLLKSNQRDTIYAFTDWVRAHVRHLSSSDDLDIIYGYGGPAPADRILYPIAGGEHIVDGCWSMTPLWAAVMRGVNIPVQLGTVEYINGLHARPIFPTINQGLSHGDDPYSRLYMSSGNPIPIADLFQPLSDIERLYIHPTPECPGGMCISAAQQASFNKAVHASTVAANALGDYLLDAYQRGGAAGLRDVLIGPSVGGAHFLHRPVMNTAEQDAVIARVEAELRRLGGGSLEEGGRIVRARISEYGFQKRGLPLSP